MGSIVNERKIASLNFVRASWSLVLSRKCSSREVTKLAVADVGSRRHNSASRREARSKALSAIRASTSARRFEGLRSGEFGLEFRFDIELEINLRRSARADSTAATVRCRLANPLR